MSPGAAPVPTSDGEPLLVAVGLAAGSPGRPVLSGVDLVLGPGDLAVLDGPSGAGNTLLLRTLAGLDAPAAGSVAVAGRPAAGALTERRAALLPQDHHLTPELTTAETVSLPLRAARRRSGGTAAQTLALLESVGLTPAARQLVTQLSGGQRQRAALARCLAAGAPLLLLDDPTAALDPDNRRRVIDLVTGHADGGGAVLATTHDPDLVDAARSRAGSGRRPVHLTIVGGRLLPVEGAP